MLTSKQRAMLRSLASTEDVIVKCLILYKESVNKKKIELC